MTRRALCGLLLAFVLAFSGSAAQLHAFAHAQADLAAAGEPHKPPAPLKHATDQCMVIHALDGTAAQPGTVLAPESISQTVFTRVVTRNGESLAAAYQSRAPPLFS